MALGRETAGHAESFDSVFDLHHDYVYGLAYNLMGNASDAEDVTQEVFIRVYKALPTYDPERAGLRTWLTHMVVNASNTQRRRNFMRALWHRPPEEGEDSETTDPVDLSPWGAPEDYSVRAEMRRTVREVLAGLRPEHRTVLVLHYYLELSSVEIARMLKVPEGTVYSRLHYARRLVQAKLERQALRATSEV